MNKLIIHREFKSRDSQSASASAFLGAGFELNGTYTSTVDLPFYKKVPDGEDFKNLYNLSNQPNLRSFVNQFIDTNNKQQETTNIGKQLFKTFFYV